MVYRTIDNTGTLPIQAELTEEQKSSLALIKASEKVPIVHVNTPEDFDKIMGKSDDD